MRKTLYAIISLLALPFLFSSCLNSDETTEEYTSDALISSFAINDIDTKVASKTSAGKDTTLIVTATGSKYVFTINQNENKIYNPDSLPVGTDISKISLDLNFIGYALTYQKNQKDTIWTSSDSLDFTNPVMFKVYAYDGTTRSYTASINVHRQDPDSLQWTTLEKTNFSVAENRRQKAVAFQNKVYVFAEGDAQVQVTSTAVADGRSWSSLKDLAGITGKADYASVIAFKDQLYILAENKLYVSADGEAWNAVGCSQSFTQLFAASSTALYGISDQHIVESEDANSWTDMGEATEFFPTKNVSFSVSPLSSNAKIERLVVVGVRDVASDTTAVVWSKLSTEKKWTYHAMQMDNIYGCPKLVDLATFYYDNDYYAFGGNPDYLTSCIVEPFGTLYKSTDRGITWKASTKKVMLPGAFVGNNQPFSYVIDANHTIWIMWSGRHEVWKGKVNRLGFVENK